MVARFFLRGKNRKMTDRKQAACQALDRRAACRRRRDKNNSYQEGGKEKIKTVAGDEGAQRRIRRSRQR